MTGFVHQPGLSLGGPYQYRQVFERFGGYHPAGHHGLCYDRSRMVRHLFDLPTPSGTLHILVVIVILTSKPRPPSRVYTGLHGTDPKDPLYGFTLHRQLYLKADPSYAGRFTVPVLWDKKRETIVNNESSEIIRMFYSAFDDLLPPERRESAHPLGGYYPSNDAALRKEIDAMNEWVYDNVNNGVYKTGFATTQEAYEEACVALFAALDSLEAILAANEKEGKGKFLLGKHLTEADIRLFPTIARFDVGYYTLFQCNLKMVRHDYPALHGWFRRLYWDEDVSETRGAFRKGTSFEHVSGVRSVF